MASAVASHSCTMESKAAFTEAEMDARKKIYAWVDCPKKFKMYNIKCLIFSSGKFTILLCYIIYICVIGNL